LNSPEQQEILRLYNSLHDKLAMVFARIARKEFVEIEIVDGIIDTLITLVKERLNETVQFILYGTKGESSIEANSLDVAVLSNVVGRSLNLPQHKLIQLTTGALLHDVGMLRLPESITNKNGSLSQNEMQTMRTHTLLTYKIVAKELNYPDTIGMVGLQHHERWDGEGYPKGLSGKAITLFARIVSVIDAFEAMISHRPYRDPMIGYSAMRALLSDNGRRFDPEILKLFIKSMGIYPIGSIVLLNNSCIGRVIQIHSESPLRPKVKIMIDENGMEFSKDEGDVVDLAEEKKLFIAKAVNPKELAAQAAE
jgi:HD-GYP domain-containing protein (c-di-GMP phosphodiesterase class II)